MASPWKISEISGNLPSSSGNCWKQQNREISGNVYGRFKCCLWECYVVFHMFCPQFPGKTTWKIKPFTPGPLINSPRVNTYNCNGPCGYRTPGRSLQSPTPKPLGHKGTWTTQSLTLGWFVTLLPPFWNPSPLARATFNQGGELPLTGEPGLPLPSV